MTATIHDLPVKTADTPAPAFPDPDPELAAYAALFTSVLPALSPSKMRDLDRLFSLPVFGAVADIMDGSR